MALLTGLGPVAELVGGDVGRLISMIIRAAATARQNRKECEQLARRVFLVAELLPHLDLEAARQMAELGDTLRDAHELVMSCQEKSAVYQLVMAGRQAEKFSEVQRKIDFYLILFPVISHIGITRRLDRIYNALVQDDSSRVELFPISESSQLQPQEVPQEVLAHGTQQLTMVEIMAATNNFALDTVIGSGGSGTVYWGSLHDGQEVAVKRISNKLAGSLGLQAYHTELNILSQLQHEHIILLIGWCATKEYKSLLKWRRKEPENMIVYEYMENGSLFQHLHPDHGSSWQSPVTDSWKVRIDVLLGLSRAIKHLHCHANPPIIHRDIKSYNILLDASWVPRLTDFGLSLKYLQMQGEESGLETVITGTLGYLDPEYYATSRVKPSVDVYGLGVVMLEVLTGKEAVFHLDNNTHTVITSFALPIIEAGNLVELLDKRPVPNPMPGQLRALEQVAQTAACCVKMEGKDRPAISDIVANLEMALELICQDEPGSRCESTPHANSIPSTGS